MARRKQQDTNKLPDNIGIELIEAKATISERKQALEKKNAEKLARLESEKLMVEEKTAPKKPVLNCNLKHNGVRYTKGQDCPQELLEVFEEKSFIEYV